MLIPAKERREVSVAVRAAQIAERNARIKDIADYAIPRARELFELGIADASNQGCRRISMQLGYKETFGSHWGCLGEALEERFGKNVPFAYDWHMKLSVRDERSDGWAYAYDKWVEMCKSFIKDLKDNGYTVMKDIPPERLVRDWLEVRW